MFFDDWSHPVGTYTLLCVYIVTTIPSDPLSATRQWIHLPTGFKYVFCDDLVYVEEQTHHPTHRANHVRASSYSVVDGPKIELRVGR
jgi:hypothetical protein